jgi:filamentous hemagglutinin family protein
MDENTARSRHPDSLGQAFLWALLPTLLLVLNAPNATYAQTNITPTTIAPLDLGTKAATPTVATTTEITGGTRPGSGTNLFHSFDSFTLGTGDIAHFMNDMQLPTTNIFARVIGKGVSTIDGTLRTNNPLNAADPMNFGQANLWLVNPSGLLLGPNARVEVGGSVSLSTANYLRFENKAALFDMLSTSASLGPLNVAPVVAFGFLGSNPAAITVQGSQLTVANGKGLSLIGGNILIESGTAEDGTAQPVQLSAPNGKIQLASAASTGEFEAATLLSRPNAGGTSFTSFGSVFLAPGSNINVSGASTVAFIKDGQLVLSVKDAVLTTSQTPGLLTETISLRQGSSIVTSNSEIDTGADVQLVASRVQMNGASMVSTTRGDGPGGDITVNVGRLSLANGALIRSDNASSGIGQGGKVTIQGRTGAGSSADSVRLTNGSSIATRSVNPQQGGDVAIAAGNVYLNFSDISTQTFVSGHGGDIHMTADSLTLENRATIFSSGSGVGGDLLLNVRTLSLLGGLSLSDGSLINSTTTSSGVGGDVTIQGISHEEGSVAEKVVLSGGSGITSLTKQSGAGGQISVTAESVDLYEGSSINSTTQGTGHGGSIVVGAQQLRVLGGAAISSNTTSNLGLPSDLSLPRAGTGGMVTVQGLEGTESKAGSVLLSGPNTGIGSDSTSGLPGEITVNAGTLTITNGAAISAGSSTSTGPAGKVTLTADSIVISPEGKIFSRSFTQASGNVTITADALTLDNGFIDTNTSSETGKPGGDVVLDVGAVSLTNGASIKSQSETFSTGRAGNIRITGGSLTLANQSEITSSSKGTVANAGDAGTITINGNAVSLASGSSITSSTIGAGSAGQVIVTTPTLNMDNATITTSTSGTGKAGSITANVGTLTLTNAAEIASSSTGTMSDAGDAGSVTIEASGSFTSNASTVSTSAENAKGGDISISAQSVQLANGTLISASSNAPLLPDGAGNAGNITITSDSNVVMQNSSVTTEASHASGGSIEIDASDAGMIQLVNSQVSTSVGGSVGVPGANDGGNINIDPQFVILQNSQIIAQAVAGAGGAINITAEVFLADPASIVDASSALGISGTVNIQSPVQNVGGRLTPLSQKFSSAAALLAQRCAARAADGKFSTFVVAGREGLPAEPGGFLASPSWVTGTVSGTISAAEMVPDTLSPLFPKYDARPIQLAMFGNACH